MADPLAYAARNRERFLEELFHFLRIPSVSARPEHAGDTRRAAEWLAERLAGAGLSTRVVPTPGHPVVLGEWREAGPDAPTVLVYGHYDVQPAEPLDEWTSPPFDPVVRDGRIYARGATDDKGQLFLHVKALEALLADGGTLPLNVLVLAEGEEEIGSPNLLPFVEAHQERLAADAVVISDSAMFAPGLPSILFSLRGLAYFELQVRGPRTDLHSGAYGGAVVNPANALARILASMQDDAGRVAIAGFYDDVREWDAETVASLRDLPFREEAFREETGAGQLGGEEGRTTLERLWTRPTCDVNGLLSGYTGAGAKTVLPARAMAKVSFRLVPDQDPARVAHLFREHVTRVAPAGVEVAVEELHGGRPWRAHLDAPLYDAATRAVEEVFGVPPVLVGEGGSIPIVVDFERILGAPVLLLGFAHPGANMHAPDEWFPLENVDMGIATLVRLYTEIGSGTAA